MENQPYGEGFSEGEMGNNETLSKVRVKQDLC